MIIWVLIGLSLVLSCALWQAASELKILSRQLHETSRKCTTLDEHCHFLQTENDHLNGRYQEFRKIMVADSDALHAEHADVKDELEFWKKAAEKEGCMEKYYPKARACHPSMRQRLS